MVGLSVLLEAQKSPQIVNKTAMIRPSQSPSSSSSSSSFFSWSSFLDVCFLCKQRLLPGKDIYMYKGDRAFCSMECRCRQILMDEDEQLMKVLVGTNNIKASSSSRQYREANVKNRASAGFAH